MTKEGSTTDPWVKRIGNHLLRYLVAQGSMTSVYLAQLPGAQGFETWVAIKIVRPDLARNKRLVQTFHNEARFSARIDHPNVCSVVDLGVDEELELPYLVMEYLHGETFSNVLRRARAEELESPVRLMVKIVVDAALGLHAAHELRRSDGELLGIVHREVSPHNITVLYDGHCKVIDFGSAKLHEQEGAAKSSESKRTYLSPEQLMGEKVDRRSDIWSLGVTLWEATLGRPLFENKDDAALTHSVLEQEIPLPSKLSKDYPPELEKILMKALERDPKQRYSTAADLASDLETYLYSEFDPAGPEEIAEWMSQVFADRLAARNVLLRSEDIPIGTVPQVDFGLEDHGRMSLEGIVTVSEEIESGFKPSIPMIAGGAVLALVLLLLVVVVASLDDDSNGELVVENSVSPPESTPPPPEKADATPDIPPPPPETQSPAADGGGAKLVSDGSSDAFVSADIGQDVTWIEEDSGATEDASPEQPRVVSPPRKTRVAALPPQITSRREKRRETRREKRAEKRPAPAPQKAKREPSPRSTGGQRGKLSLMAIPPAKVHVGGRSLGRTPLFNVELPPGRHRLRVEALDGSGSKTITVQIKAGEVVRRSVRF